MDPLQELLQLAGEYKDRRYPPWMFFELMELRRSSVSFNRMAWELFLREKRKLSIQEIQDYIKEQQDQIVGGEG